MENDNKSKFLHLYLDISVEYKNCSIHIALERADEKEDWETFKKIFKCCPKFLKNHLDMTDMIFEYNYKALTNEEQDKLFN